MNYGIGIDLGGSSVKAVAVTRDGTVLERCNEAFDPGRRLHFAETIRSLVQRLASGLKGPPDQIGLSAPGLAARDASSIAYMPGRLDGLVGLNWSEYLATPFTIPVLNDGHAALLGEVWRGAARGCRNVIMITLGTGVGGAAMVDGRLLRGHTGKAGHLGHATLDLNGPPDICNMPGSLEIAMGNCSIQHRSSGRFTTTHEVVTAYLKDDPLAAEVWLKSIRALACAIGSFTNILDPEVCVIGGGIARAGAALLDPLEPLVRGFEWHIGGPGVRIVPAELGELAGAFGAAWRGFNSCE